MTTKAPETGETLPGLEYAKSSGVVRRAYETAIDALREKDLLRAEHEGLAATLLRLADVLDDPRAKGYSIGQVSSQAHDIMNTLLALDTSDETDTTFADLLRSIQEPQA